MDLKKAKVLIDRFSKENAVSTQLGWDNLFFDEIIARLSKSKYKNNFVFKGGLYLQSITGLKQRSTMDIDFKLIGATMSNEQIKAIFSEICNMESNNILFTIKSISDIMAETKYGGKTIKIEGNFYNVTKNFSIDIETSDVVTIYPINYEYKSNLNGETYNILAYPIESIIAEKFETLISKGQQNSRSKDLYDLYLLSKMNYNDELLNSSMINTFNLRKTKYNKESINNILEEIFSFERIINLYENYKNKNKFVQNVTFNMCKDAIFEIYNKLVFNECIKLSNYGITLHLIRHGEDEQDFVGGWSSNHLTTKGKNEVNSLINLIDNNYDLFISSDLNRTKETSLILNQKLNMNIIYDQNFRETNNGILKNMTKKEFIEKYKNYIFSNLEMNEHYPNGESPLEFYNRIKNSFINLLENNKNKKILLVTHGGVITIIMCLIYGWPYSNKLKITPKTGSILKLK